MRHRRPLENVAIRIRPHHEEADHILLLLHRSDDVADRGDMCDGHRLEVGIDALQHLPRPERSGLLSAGDDAELPAVADDVPESLVALVVGDEIEALGAHIRLYDGELVFRALAPRNRLIFDQRKEVGLSDGEIGRVVRHHLRVADRALGHAAPRVAGQVLRLENLYHLRHIGDAQ